MTNHPNRSKSSITSQMVAQGSYGLYRINQRTGQRLGSVITVWHARRDGQNIGTFLTRAEARDALSSRATDDAAMDDYNYVGSRHHY